jgi:SAM-dependent methyltransferase
VQPQQGYERSAHLYDIFDSKPNVDFFMHYASEVDQILDIGAGTGRIAIPMAKRGVRVWCVEPSPAMRHEFEKKLAGHPELRAAVTLVDADAAGFSLARSFGAAFMSGSFDHLLSDDERVGALSNVARHLVPGANLVFDVFLGCMGNSPLKPAGEISVGDRVYRRFVGRKPLPRKCLEVKLVFEIHRGGQVVGRIEEHSLAGITDREAVHDLLRKAGFAVTREFGDFDFGQFQDGSDLLVVEATRLW